MRDSEMTIVGCGTRLRTEEVWQGCETRFRDELRSERRGAEAVRHGLLKNRANSRASALKSANSIC